MGVYTGTTPLENSSTFSTDAENTHTLWCFHSWVYTQNNTRTDHDPSHGVYTTANLDTSHTSINSRTNHTGMLYSKENGWLSHTTG